MKVRNAAQMQNAGGSKFTGGPIEFNHKKRFVLLKVKKGFNY